MHRGATAAVAREPRSVLPRLTYTCELVARIGFQDFGPGRSAH